MCGRARRKEDMSPDGFLDVFIDTDNNDIHVTVCGESHGEMVIASVEFCCVGIGGGKSPKTREALRNLFKAIREDNKEIPCRAVEI
jgi:hypothetical protein